MTNCYGVTSPRCYVELPRYELRFLDSKRPVSDVFRCGPSGLFPSIRPTGRPVATGAADETAHERVVTILLRNR